MTKIGKSNAIAFSIMLVIITALSSAIMYLAMTLSPPSNYGAIWLTWISGLAFGLYCGALVIVLSDR